MLVKKMLLGALPVLALAGPPLLAQALPDDASDAAAYELPHYVVNRPGGDAAR